MHKQAKKSIRYQKYVNTPKIRQHIKVNQPASSAGLLQKYRNMQKCTDKVVTALSRRTGELLLSVWLLGADKPVLPACLKSAPPLTSNNPSYQMLGSRSSSGFCFFSIYWDYSLLLHDTSFGVWTTVRHKQTNNHTNTNKKTERTILWRYML